MKTVQILFVITLFILGGKYVNAQLQSSSDQIINIQHRDTISLNGQWKYIVDQYENGYFNYRYQPIDQQENASQVSEAIFNDSIYVIVHQNHKTFLNR